MRSSHGNALNRATEESIRSAIGFLRLAETVVKQASHRNAFAGGTSRYEWDVVNSSLHSDVHPHEGALTVTASLRCESVRLAIRAPELSKRPVATFVQRLAPGRESWTRQAGAAAMPGWIERWRRSIETRTDDLAYARHRAEIADAARSAAGLLCANGMRSTDAFLHLSTPWSQLAVSDSSDPDRRRMFTEVADGDQRFAEVLPKPFVDRIKEMVSLTHSVEIVTTNGRAVLANGNEIDMPRIACDLSVPIAVIIPSIDPLSAITEIRRLGESWAIRHAAA